MERVSFFGVVAVLGVCTVLGMAGMVWLSANGREIPNALATITGQCAGLLGGMLINPRDIRSGGGGGGGQ